MKKITTLLLTFFGAIPLFAQFASGFYRVQNYTTERYITVIDNRGSINIKTNSADLQAIQTLSGFERVECNPASVIYFENAGLISATDYAYDLQAQGTGMVEIVGFHVFLHQVNKNIVQAYRSKDGVTVYLSDRSKDWGDTAQVTTDYNKTKNWRVIPINENDNYIGVQPQLKVGSYYYQTLYTSYGYQLLSRATKAFTVTAIKDGIAIWKEVTSDIPTATPVIIQSTSNQGAQNKMQPLYTTTATVGTNQLRGVYFNCAIPNHVNQVKFNANTMRVLGKLSDGSLGFINKANFTYIPANTAYLTVPSGTPAELKLMTQTEYDAYMEEQARNTPVTITAKSYTREYGEANPTFDYTLEGTLLGGTPVLSCSAKADSPAGTYPIVVAAGTVKNTNLTLLNGTLTITKAPLTVKANDATKVEQEPNPALTITYSGFKNSDNASVLTKQPTASTKATVDSPAGTYDITVSGGESDRYAFTYKKGTLTVTAQPAVTITAKNYTREYGDENPKLEYTVTSGELLGGEPVLSCAATKDSPAGEYPITIAAGTVKNIHRTLVAGTLTITKAPLTVKASDATKVEQEANPTLSVTYSGFKNGDKPSVLTKQPTASTKATVDSPAGTYDIIVSGGECDRYAFTYKKGMLTVTERPAITITAMSYTREYGDANPTLEYTITGGELLGGEPVLSCAATVDSPAGEYPITIEAGTVKNWHHTLVAGTLTITKAPLIVKADDLTKMEQFENPTLTLTYTGFKNGDTADILIQQPTAFTMATIDSPVGTYGITVSGGESDRYAFTYNAGTLIVTEQPVITITAVSYFREYGDANPTLEYVVTGGELFGGEPVLTCEATKDSPVGEYPITITEGTVTNLHYTLVAGTLTVTKAPLVVQAVDCVKIEQEENPELQLTYSGFKNDDTPSVLIQLPTATTEATVDSHAGTYEIVVSGGESDRYDFLYRNGTLTVRQRDQIIIAAVSCTREYGDSNPTLEYTIEGEQLEGAPVLTCTATADSPAGEYPIEVAIGTVTNYNYILVNGTLTITKAPLTVQAADCVKVEQDENPAFEISYSGFKNEDDETILIQEPVATTDATIDSRVGTYDIIVSGGESDRYTFNYKKGTLTVNQRDPIIISVVNCTREYGDENPTFEYTIEGELLGGEPELTCEAAVDSPAGEYPIEVAIGTVVNFNYVLKGGTLTISKAPLTVSVNDASRHADEENPEFELTYTGFKNDDDVNILQVVPVVETEATVNCEPGEYDLVVSGGESDRYVFTYVNGTLTVTEPSAISSVMVSGLHPVDVYTLSGTMVRHQATTLKGLPKGVYLIGGKKVTIR